MPDSTKHIPRVCERCSRGYVPSSAHLLCPSCRSADRRKACPECGNLMTAEATTCRNCAPGLRKRNKKRGGTRFIKKSGYVYVSCEDHPRATGRGRYVLEHILVMEQVLGRYVEKGETIHHRNGIRHDNRPENLELWSSNHPSGARVTDLTEWAVEHLRKYAPDKLK